MKSSKTLSQRRSLAAKRGWETRRKKKRAAFVEGVLRESISKIYGKQNTARLDEAWAAIAERAKTAPVVADSANWGTTSNGTLYPLSPASLLHDNPQSVIESIKRAHREREAQSKHPGSAHTNDQREYAPELLLTEGMRVREKIWTRICVLIDRFVKRLGAKT